MLCNGQTEMIGRGGQILIGWGEGYQLDWIHMACYRLQQAARQQSGHNQAARLSFQVSLGRFLPDSTFQSYGRHLEVHVCDRHGLCASTSA